jgi:hypothetical protein
VGFGLTPRAPYIGSWRRKIVKSDSFCSSQLAVPWPRDGEPVGSRNLPTCTSVVYSAGHRSTHGVFRVVPCGTVIGRDGFLPACCRCSAHC